MTATQLMSKGEPTSKSRLTLYQHRPTQIIINLIPVYKKVMFLVPTRLAGIKI
jgi:hypothetical protein